MRAVNYLIDETQKRNKEFKVGGIVQHEYSDSYYMIVRNKFKFSFLYLEEGCIRLEYDTLKEMEEDNPLCHVVNYELFISK